MGPMRRSTETASDRCRHDPDKEARNTVRQRGLALHRARWVSAARVCIGSRVLGNIHTLRGLRYIARCVSANVSQPVTNTPKTNTTPHRSLLTDTYRRHTPRDTALMPVL